MAVGVARAEAAVASRTYVAGRRVPRSAKVRGAHHPHRELVVHQHNFPDEAVVG